MKKAASASALNQKVSQEAQGSTAEVWCVSTKDLEIYGNHGNSEDFEVKSLRQPGMSLSWVKDEATWMFSRDGNEVCRVPGEPPFSDLAAFTSAKASSKKYASKGAERTASGLSGLSELAPRELRRQCMLSVAYGDPYGAFCALASGADLATPMRECYQHPVSAALERRNNPSGHARLKRPLAEVRGWLDLLGAFGGTLDHRDLNREGKPSTLSVGQCAAWGTDEARQAAIERGVDFGPPLAQIMANDDVPESRSRDQSIFKFLAECGEDGARAALASVGDALFDERDRRVKDGGGGICDFDRQAAELLGKGHTTAFFAACKISPRINAKWAMESGIVRWVNEKRYEVCKGIKPAQKFQSDLQKIYKGLCAGGQTAETFSEAIGKALGSSCRGSKALAMEHAVSKGGLAVIDLSFLEVKAVARGAFQVNPFDTRGAFELALLSKAGLTLDHFEVWVASSALSNGATDYIAHARAELASIELRNVLSEVAPSPKPTSKSKARTL